MKLKSLLYACVLASLLAAQNAFAVSSYVSRVPNGGTFSCSTCHDVANGPPGRNPFGSAFASNNHAWNATLANLDSDGDGAKNGAELGDPSGSGTPTSGAQVTNPGDPASKPSATAPSITTQPASQTVTAGANVTFTVAATGTAPLSYQWKKSGANISGATSTSLALSSVTSASAGSYAVQVSNSAGSATSSTATLTVNPAVVAPSITTQPASQTVTAGANVTFTVAASGTAPLSYQWKKSGANISGATSTSLALSGVTSADAGSYTVQVSNSAGSATSGTATLTVSPVVAAPSITTQPASQTVTAGANVTFTVAASGTAPLGYQWKKNGGNIAGATSTSLALSGVTSAEAGSYTVQVSNSAGSVTSGTATLTVSPVVVAPSITTQPASQPVTTGDNVTFMVAATGTAPLGYQWKKNGGNIAGATSASLALNGVTSADAGNYTVQVSNSAGSVTSGTATLTVNAGTAVLSIALVSPTNGASYALGANVDLAAELSDATGVTGVGFFDDTNLCGVVTAAPYSMTTSNLAAGEHVLRAMATDAQGTSALSEPVTITIGSATPPTTTLSAVEIVIPTSGASFGAPARIVLVARVADSSSPVSRVQFYSGSTRLGTAMPFSERELDDDESTEGSDSNLYMLTWNRVRAGTYTVRAVVSYRSNPSAKFTSEPVQIIVKRSSTSSSSTSSGYHR
jgi:hypothetical protein